MNLESIIITLYVCFACYLAICNVENNFNVRFHQVRDMLTDNHPTVGKSCINGAAFTLISDNVRAAPYTVHHKKCIDKILSKYVKTIILQSEIDK